jgi:hypothetical protein
LIRQDILKRTEKTGYPVKGGYRISNRIFGSKKDFYETLVKTDTIKYFLLKI